MTTGELLVFCVVAVLVFAGGIMLGVNLANHYEDPIDEVIALNSTAKTLLKEVRILQDMQTITSEVLIGLNTIAPPPKPDTIYVTIPDPRPLPRTGSPYHGVTVP